jgi:hypothetical protein
VKKATGPNTLNNPQNKTPETPETPETPVTTNTLPVVSRPQSMVSYTIFPYIPSVTTTETDEILLSEIQIHDFTESFIYNLLNNSNISTTVCPISLEPFQEGDLILKIRHCGHEFKSVFLRQWFRRSSRCPLCRCNLLTPSVNRTSRSSSVAFSDISMNVSNTERESIQLENANNLSTQTQEILPDSLVSNSTDVYTSFPNSSGDRRSLSELVTQRLLGTEAPLPELSPNSSGDFVASRVSSEGGFQSPFPDATVLRTSSLGSNSNTIRELYSTLLNTTNDLNQSTFNDIFQNILMESTDAPPNISNAGMDSIPNIRPIIMSLLQNSLSSSIESIDITYTVDYDISNN